MWKIKKGQLVNLIDASSFPRNSTGLRRAISLST